ncbi:MAG: DUF1189 domain-containing protein [Candidatus Izimaplasma sp.]|nr:DUF1189 domain-containing protein [Candidatus Izimaplasma bacterium]
MLTRFKDALVYPRRVIRYRKDAMWKVLLYIAFFALLLTTRTIISTIKYDGLSYQYKEHIKENVTPLASSCEIVESDLNCDEQINTKLYEETFFEFHINSNNTLDTSYYSGMYNFVFHQDTFNIIFSGVSVKTYKISELPEEFHNIDFDLMSENPDLFYNQFFDGVDQFVVSYKTFWAPIILVFDFLSSVVLFLFFILLSSWFLKMRFKVLPFKEIFKMITYISTALYVILILDSLYQLNIFFVLILIFIAFRQTNALSLEIYRRLNKKKPKDSENNNV